VSKSARKKSNEIRDAFYSTFDWIGGINSLYKWVNESKQNKRLFYEWMIKLLPKEVTVDGDGLKQNQIILIRSDSKNEVKEVTEGIPIRGMGIPKSLENKHDWFYLSWC